MNLPKAMPESAEAELPADATPTTMKQHTVMKMTLERVK
jgi:hypothetical protein